MALSSDIGLRSDTKKSPIAKGQRRALWCTRTALLVFIFGLLFNFFVVVRWARQPLLDQHYFRQTQTAMTVWWLVHQSGWTHWVDYQTPVFGSPWQIPLEFPLFQWIVALVCLATGLPLDPLGRCLSALFFYATLWPLWMLARDFGLNRRAFFLAGGLLLLSPVYLYWSRCFLIESTALFFSLLYLASLKRYLVGRKKWWLLLLTLAGIAGVLTKVTTFVPFAICAGLTLAIYIWQQRLWREPLHAVQLCGPPVVSLLLCALIIELWMHHTEGLIRSSYFGYVLTPGQLHGWTYGALGQRISPELWRDTIWQRAINDALGSRLLLLVLLIPSFSAQPRLGAIKAILVALFLLPFLWITNLHIVHNYYQYATAVFLVLAVALGLWQLGEFNSPVLFVLVCGLAVFAEVRDFCRGFLHSVRTNYSEDALLRVAGAIREQTPRDSVLLIVGCEWNPALAYYSERRSIYIPSWARREQVERLLEAPHRLTDGRPLAAVVDYPGGYPPSGTELWSDFLGVLSTESVLVEEAPYKVYFPRNAHAWEQALASFPPATEALSSNIARTNGGTWMKYLPASWVANEKIQADEGRLERIEHGGKVVTWSNKPLLTEAGSELGLKGGFKPGNANNPSTVLLEISGKESWFLRLIEGTSSSRSEAKRHDLPESFGFDFHCRLPDQLPEDIYQLSIYRTNSVALCRLHLPLQLEVANRWMETLPPEWPAIGPATPALGNLERIELNGKPVAETNRPLIVRPGAVLKLLGWSADRAGDDAAPERLLALQRTGDNVVRYVPVQRWARPDVARTLGNPRLQETGFKITCKVGPAVPAGIYGLDVIQKGTDAQFKIPVSIEVLP